MESNTDPRSILLAPPQLSRRAATVRIGGAGLAVFLAASVLPAAAQEASPATGASGERPYVVTRQYRFAPGRTMAELIDAVTAGFIPIVREVPGFIEYYFVETPNGVLTIGVFQDPAGAEESTKRAADWIQENLTGFYEGPPTVTTGTIWLHEAGGMTTGTPTPA